MHPCVVKLISRVLYFLYWFHVRMYVDKFNGVWIIISSDKTLKSQHIHFTNSHHNIINFNIIWKSNQPINIINPSTTLWNIFLSAQSVELTASAAINSSAKLYEIVISVQSFKYPASISAINLPVTFSSQSVELPASIAVTINLSAASSEILVLKKSI